MIYPSLFILFFAAILAYLRIAVHYNIIDHPNERSSHDKITIRGGGIVFLLAAVCTVIMHHDCWLPASGILIIGLISFLDDIYTLSSGLRLFFHLLAVSIMFMYLDIFHIEPIYGCFLLYIIVIGVINMYNFMDGINGITGVYSLVVLAGLQYVNLNKVAFIQADIIWLPILACSVFLFFNLRKKAKCFAGDVGSVTIAFWIIMLLVKLISITHNWSYILFLVVYGVDSVLTITHRLILRQNIFKAHRFHFYQILANEQKFAHAWVASGYALIQGGIIMLIIRNSDIATSCWFVITVIPLSIIYVSLKPVFTKNALTKNMH